MSTILYTLWDTRTINLVGEFDSQCDALELVLSGIELNGLKDSDTLSLQIEDEHGEVWTIAWGQPLAELALRTLRAIPARSGHPGRSTAGR